MQSLSITYPLLIKRFNLCDYHTVWQKMKLFTDSRTPDTLDEVWLLQHFPVFTQGQAGKAEHILNAGDIPVIQTDRGGQVTYHGPGQLVAYTLFDLTRLQIGTRALVRQLENTVIALLKDYNVQAEARIDAPGVYVNDAKICSIGLRVRRGCSYHGIALNVAMDLSPFSRINPCGFQNMKMTQLSDFVPDITLPEVEDRLSKLLSRNFGYNLYNVENSK